MNEIKRLRSELNRAEEKIASLSTQLLTSVSTFTFTVCAIGFKKFAVIVGKDTDTDETAEGNTF